MNYKPYSLAFPIFFLILIVGCGPVIKYSALNDSYTGASRSDSIRVFVTNLPACEYEELGIVYTSTGAFSGDVDTFVEAMRNKALSVGGDAIILKDATSRNSGLVEVTPGVLAATDTQEQSGTIVRFTDSTCME